MTGSKKLKIATSSGNVLRDIKFCREHLLVRADLMIHLQKLISSRCLKRRTAAKILPWIAARQRCSHDCQGSSSSLVWWFFRRERVATQD